jgi:arylsulfatase
MKKILSLFSLLLALFAGLLAPVSAVPPNIIIVMPDDVGYGDFACLGNPVIRTPAVDAFWAESVRFTDFHVSPTCAPTRGALLTGRHEFKNGITHTILERERLTLKATTLPQMLKAAGYATGIFGKWHLGDEPERWPDKRGFDEMFIHGAGGIGQTYPGTCGDAPGNTNFSPAILHNGKFVKTEGYCTDVFFRQAQRWIDAVKDRGPFFAYITPNAAHEPLDVAEEYTARHRGAVPENVAKFYGMIENVDENFGRLLAHLKAAGLEKNTLVVFLTDNGGTAGVKFFNGGRRGAKGTPYQGGTRVPSMWRWPAGFAGGREVSALTAHVDMFRTLAEVAEVKLSPEVEKQVEGRNLLPLLKEPGAAWPDRFLVTHVGRWPKGQIEAWKDKNSSIRDHRFTLVANKELYDLENDPAETKNVLAEHPAEAAKLRAAYDVWWQEVQPHLENENVVAPKMNPLKALYWEQFGGGPDEALRRQMDPDAPGQRKF